MLFFHARNHGDSNASYPISDGSNNLKYSFKNQVWRILWPPINTKSHVAKQSVKTHNPLGATRLAFYRKSSSEGRPKAFGYRHQLTAMRKYSSASILDSIHSFDTGCRWWAWMAEPGLLMMIILALQYLHICSQQPKCLHGSLTWRDTDLTLAHSAQGMIVK